MGASSSHASAKHGDLLPADSQGEISERQEAFRRQEREISEKRSQYAALQAALEEERRKGAAARQALREATAESDQCKGKVKDLTASLKSLELEVAELEGNQGEKERLQANFQQLSSAEHSNATETDINRLQTEVLTYLAQIPTHEADYDRFKAEMDLCQQRLRDCEASISLLERSEVDRESALGGEVSQQEAGKRRDHLRVLYWLALRKVQGVKQKYVAVWRQRNWAERKRSGEMGEIGREIEGIAGEIGGIAMEDMGDCGDLIGKMKAWLGRNREMGGKAGEVFAPLAKLTAEMTNLLSAVGERAESLSAEFTDNEATIHAAAEIEVLTQRQAQLQSLTSAVQSAIQYLETSETALSDSQSLLSEAEKAINRTVQSVEISEKQLSEVHSALKSTLIVYEARLNSDQRGRIGALMEEITAKSKTVDRNRDITAEGLQLLSVFPLSCTELRTAKANCPKSRSQLALVLGNLQDLLSKAAQSPPSLHPQASPLQEEVSETVELTVEETVDARPVEMEVAAGNPENSPVLRTDEDSAVDSGEFTEEERREIRANPVRKLLKQTQFAQFSLMSAEEVMERCTAFLTSAAPTLLSNTPFPRISALLLSHFLPDSSSEAQDAFSSFVQSLSQLASDRPNTYVSLLASALGLSLPFPFPDSQAKLVSIAESLVSEHSQRLEKTTKGPKQTIDEVLASGGRLYLVDAIKAVYQLFPASPAMGETALRELKPASISLPDHLNFMILLRLQELKLDSLKLFKQIDANNNGKLNGEELAMGVQRRLGLWMSVESLKTLFKLLDADGSDSISRIEFAKAVNFKEYYQKCESPAYTLTKVDFLRAALAALQGWRREVALPLEAKAKEMLQERELLSTSEVIEALRGLEGKLPSDYLSSVTSSLDDSPSIPQLLLSLVSTPPPAYQCLSTPYTARFHLHSA